MRSLTLHSCFILTCAALAATACGDDKPATNYGSQCAVGEEPCSSGCVAAGTCPPGATGGGTGVTTGATGGATEVGVGGATTAVGTGGTTGAGAAPGTGGTTTAPGTGGSTGIIIPEIVPVSANCPDGATSSGIIDTHYGGSFINANNGDKHYFMHANWWGLSEEEHPSPVIRYDGLSFEITSQPNAASSTNPIGFPSLFIGSYAGHTTKNSNLPIRVGDISRIPTTLNTNLTSPQAGLNIAYDVWFTDDGAVLQEGQYDPSDRGALLMVWLFDPSSEQPRGQAQEYGVSVGSPLGSSWDIWVDETADNDGRAPCYSYVSTSFLSDIDFNLNDFIRDAVQRGYLSDNQYLNVIFGGMEVWRGGAGVSVDGFCAIVE